MGIFSQRNAAGSDAPANDSSSKTNSSSKTKEAQGPGSSRHGLHGALVLAGLGLAGVGAAVAYAERDNLPRNLPELRGALEGLVAPKQKEEEDAVTVKEKVELGIGDQVISSKTEFELSLINRAEIRAITLGGNFSLKDADLFEFSNLKEVKYISVNGAPNLTGDFLQYFKGESLWKVQLENLRSFNQESLANLTYSTTIKHLSILNCDLGEEAFKWIAQMNGLTTLCIAGRDIPSDECLSKLIAPESQLRYLIIHSLKPPSPAEENKLQDFVNTKNELSIAINYDGVDGGSIEFLSGAAPRK